MKLNSERQDGAKDDSSTIADGVMSSPNISNTTVVCCFVKRNVDNFIRNSFANSNNRFIFDLSN